MQQKHIVRTRSNSRPIIYLIALFSLYYSGFDDFTTKCATGRDPRRDVCIQFFMKWK